MRRTNETCSRDILCVEAFDMEKRKACKNQKKSANRNIAQRVASSTAIVLSLTVSALLAPARLFFSTFSMNASPAL